MLIMEAPLLETLILFLILVVEEIIVVRVVVQARLLKMKTKSDKKSTSMVAWKGKSLSYLVFTPIFNFTSIMVFGNM